MSLFLTYTRSGPAFTSETFGGFYQAKTFTDVRLMSSDGLAIEGHKVVLAAASPMLKKRLLDLPEGRRDLRLDLFSHNVLLAVLDLIYKGTARVKVDEREDFQAAVRFLALKLDPDLKKRIYDDQEDEGRSGKQRGSQEFRGASQPLSEGVSHKHDCIIFACLNFSLSFRECNTYLK